MPTFFLNRSKGYAPRWGQIRQNLSYSIDLMYRPYNIASTNVLHCEPVTIVGTPTAMGAAGCGPVPHTESSRRAYVKS